MNVRKAICLFLSLTLAFCMTPIAAFAQTGDLAAGQSSLIATQSGISSNQTAVIKERIAATLAEIDETNTFKPVSLLDLSISVTAANAEKLTQIASEELKAHPDSFYIDITQFRFNTRNSMYLSLEFKANCDTSKIPAMKKKYEAALADVLSWVPNGATQPQKAKAVHDWLVWNCSYNTEAAKSGGAEAYGSQNPWTAYGALVDNSPVCEGYSLAFIAAMNRLGIESTYVSQSTSAGNHGWNRVLLDGSWYNLDVTWDDNITEQTSSAKASTRFFVKSDKWFKANKTSDGFHGSWSPAGVAGTNTKYDSYTDWQSYPLTKTNINKATISAFATQRYTGKPKTPEPVVKYDGKKLVKGKDYVIVKYENNVNVGKASVTVKGVGSFTGSKTAQFTIKTASIASATVATIPNQAYTGKPVNPSPKITLGGVTLKKDVDYTLSYLDSKGNTVKASSVKKGDTFYYVVAKGKGNYSGTTAKRSFRILSPHVSYRTNVQSLSWQSWRSDGASAGTSGKGLRLEALQVKLATKPVSGSVAYRAHVQNIGWQAWAQQGATAGVADGGLRMEAVQIKLTGNMAKKYDIYYRLHVERTGWMGWAKNGAQAGTAGFGYRVEAMQVKIVPKGAAAPGPTANCFKKKA